jgi:hypothetical protein
MGLDITFIIGPKDINISTVETTLCDCEIGDTTCCNMWEKPHSGEKEWTGKDIEDRSKLKHFRFWKPELSRNNSVLFKLIPYNIDDIYSPVTSSQLRHILTIGSNFPGPKMDNDLQILESILETIDFTKEGIWVDVSF